ncbi:MAG: MBL fold metallo-hydrolase [Bacteroidales bacterium]
MKCGFTFTSISVTSIYLIFTSIFVVLTACNSISDHQMKKKVNLKEYIAKLTTNKNDMTIKTFHFNFLQVNTYVVYDETKEAVIIDPGNQMEKENDSLVAFIAKEGLKVKYILNTHPHIDHILGNSFCVKTFGAPLWIHEAGIPIYNNASAYGVAFGFDAAEYPVADRYLKEGDEIVFGHQKWEVIYTPGHADGSVCFLDRQNNLIFVGDVLFEGSIGRADLPTGNAEVLIKNIKEKLMTLEEETVVYCGHGDCTTIGKEKKQNPYIN